MSTGLGFSSTKPPLETAVFNAAHFQTSASALSGFEANKCLETDSVGNAVASNTNSSKLTFLNNVNADINTSLNSKQDTINDGDLSIAKTNGLQAALDGKQATISDGDLTIAKTNGLQTAAE